MKYTVKHGLITCLALAVAAMLLPWIVLLSTSSSYASSLLSGIGTVPVITVSGAYIGCAGTAGVFEFFDYLKIMDAAGIVTLDFWQSTLVFMILLVVVAGFVLPVISLFLSVFTKSKKATVAVLTMQIVSTVIAAAELITLVWAENYIGMPDLFKMGAGPVVFLVALIASVIAAVMIVKRYVDNEAKPVYSDPSRSGVLCLAGEYQGVSIPLDGTNAVVLGRDATCCNLVLSGNKISRKHCEITFIGGKNRYRVTDFSTNGVFVEGGTKLDRGTPVELVPGTVICLGNELNKFRLQ